jgi:hypothetical protein
VVVQGFHSGLRQVVDYQAALPQKLASSSFWPHNHQQHFQLKTNSETTVAIAT